MQISLKKNKKNKTVHIVADKVNGHRLGLTYAYEIFALEDEGYELIPTNKRITKKISNFRVPCNLRNI